MLSINTNLSSMIVQNSMGQSTSKLNQAIERMSTGFKINHASDNAACYSICTNMTTKMSAYQVAEDNVSMGLDMLTTASENLSQIESKLARLRALATQASNGTYGTQSKDAINSEANALVDEIERLYNTSEYNGIKLFENQKSNANANMPQAGADGFIKTVEKQDTSSLKKLSEVSSTADLADDTYSISSADELAKLAQMTNDGYISEGDTFVLAKDIDLAQWCADHSDEGGWTPIGNNTNKFLGTFNGNGHKISNLKINRSGVKFQGLFGRTDGNSVIKNLGVTNVDITSDSDCTGAIVGGVIANTNTHIDNCYSTGQIFGGGQSTGGIAGQAEDTTNCYSSCDIKSSGGDTGGLIGTASKNSIVENCYATGNLTSEGNFCGGLIGYFEGISIKNSYTTGNVNGLNNFVGGLIGAIMNTTATIDSCYTTANIEGKNAVGGLIGANFQNAIITITNSYCTGNVLGLISNIGGFVGYTHNYSTTIIENCYTKGSVSGTVDTAGFVGYMGGNSNVSMKNCSVLGLILGEKNSVFLARNNLSGKGTLIIENCKYNSELNGTSRALVRSASDKGELDITDDSIRSEVSTCGFITPFDFSGDINVGLQVGIDSSENARINLTTNFELSYLNNLRQIGKSDGDLFSVVDHMLNTISEKQTQYGAVQNRLESALDEIAIQYDNLASSRSTLRDADMAELSSEYIKMQILQQASATLLATANQSPSIALQLI